MALQVDYHALLAGSPDTVILLDLDQNRIIDANTNAEKMLGCPAGQLLASSLADLCPPLQADGTPSSVAMAAHIASVLAGEIKVFELRFAHKDGHVVDCEMRLVLLPTEGRQLMHARIVDISRRKLDEQLRMGQGRILEMVARGAALADTLDSLMLLIESQSTGVFCSVLLLDEDGFTIHPAAGPSLPKDYMAALDGFPIGPSAGSCGTAMFRKEAVIVTDILTDPLWTPYKFLIEPHGFRACWSTPIYLNREQVLGSFAMYYRDVRSPEAADMRLIAVATHLAGIAIERTRRERELAQHREHLEELVAARTAELTAAIDRTEIANRDLAQALETLRQAQKELVRRDKLAALGTLVAGVAHELNTPIGNSLVVATTMNEHANELAASVATGLRRSTLESYLNDAQQAGELLARNLHKAADLVASFKQIAVDQTSSQRRCFSLSQLISEVMPPLCVPARHRPIKFEQEVEPGLAMDSYPGPLTQVLTNLFDNALLHAFEPDSAGTVRVKAGTRPDGMLAISVQDSGAGISVDNQARVYDPFFTTRLGAGSTGLGLHVAHNIVTGVLGGRIELDSAPGQGSTFTVLLPPVAPIAIS